MPEKSWCMRRRFSGFMAFVIMFIYVFNHSFLSSSRGTGIYAAEADVSTPSEAVRDRSVTLKNHPAEVFRSRSCLIRPAMRQAISCVLICTYKTTPARRSLTAGFGTTAGGYRRILHISKI